VKGDPGGYFSKPIKTLGDLFVHTMLGF